MNIGRFGCAPNRNRNDDGHAACWWLFWRVVAIWYVVEWFLLERAKVVPTSRRPASWMSPLGFVTDFFDTLGIGSFAPTTALFKLWRRMPDEQIPVL